MRIPVLKSGVVTTKVGEESIVYPNISDEEITPYIIAINEIGTFVVSKVDGLKSVDDISSEVVKIYDVDYKTAVKDIESLLKDLESKKIIIWKQ